MVPLLTMQFHNGVNKWFRSGSGKRRRPEHDEQMHQMQQPSAPEILARRADSSPTTPLLDSDSDSQELLDKAFAVQERIKHARSKRVKECLQLFEAVVACRDARQAKSCTRDDYMNAQIAEHELAVLHSQLGNHSKADTYLAALGFSHKLSPEIFQPKFRDSSTSGNRYVRSQSAYHLCVCVHV